MKEIEKINELAKELMGKYYKEILDGDWWRKTRQPTTKFIKLEKTSEKEPDKKELLGLACISVIESLTRKSLVIEDIIIDKENRGLGWGKDMINQIIDIAKKNNLDCVEVCTKKDNKIARKLYEKMGFKDRRNIAYRLWLK